jgi:hypothetical protein
MEDTLEALEKRLYVGDEVGLVHSALNVVSSKVVEFGA